MMSPIKAFRRHNIKKYINNNNALTIKDSDGFLKLPNSYLSGIDKIVAYYENLFSIKEKNIKTEYRQPYSLVINTNDNPEAIKPVLEFSKQPELYEILCRYIGELPVISSVSLMYTEPDENVLKNLQSSQLFHRDMNERRQLHLLMPIWEIDIDSGPFTFLPSNKSALVTKATQYNSGRLTDAAVFNVVSKNDLISLTGKPGSAFLVNPYRCFHYGARATKKRRLILIVNYTSVFEGAEGQLAIYRSKNRKLLNDGSAKTKAFLNL